MTSAEPSRFEVTCQVPVSREALFNYHAAPGALERLIPPWESVAIESSDRSLDPGSRVVLKMGLGPIPLRWVAVHGKCEPPKFFEDRQESGPFAAWHHLHRFDEVPRELGGGAMLTDHVDYRLPLGRLGAFFGGRAVRGQLEAMFRYRHRVTHDDLILFDRYPSRPMAIAVSGASGLVGTQLGGLLGLAGHRVIRLVRDIAQGDGGTGSLGMAGGSGPNPLARGASPAVAVWGGPAEAKRLEGIDAVVHLAGKSIGEGRWNERRKREIRDSRVIPTRQLCEALAKSDSPPKTLVCASAIGIYGDRGDELLDEQSPPGDDFLSRVAKEWEDACRPAREAGIRVVHLRLGIVLSPRGGALQKLLLPTKLGLGGRMGSGKQWGSWIGIDDVISAIYHAIATPALAGPINLVSPNPVTNAEFIDCLAHVLRRPAWLPAPAPLLRLALGEMAQPLLLGSTRVAPTKLVESGYQFRDPSLVGCLRHLLGRSSG